MEKSAATRRYAVLLETLRDARQAAGVTQRQLADRLQTTQSFVSKFEQGALRLDLLQLREVCLALGITLPALVAEFERRLARKSRPRNRDVSQQPERTKKSSHRKQH